MEDAENKVIFTLASGETVEVDPILLRPRVGSAPDAAEVWPVTTPALEIAQRHGFWRKLSRRLNLMGDNSFVVTAPYRFLDRFDLTRAMKSSLAFVAFLEGRLGKKGSIDEPEAKEIERPDAIDAALSECAPQFVLRNIERLERSTDVRFADIQYVVWREPLDEDFADIRRARHAQASGIDLGHAYSHQLLKQSVRENRDRVLGWRWSDEAGEFEWMARAARPPKLSFPIPVVPLSKLRIRPRTLRAGDDEAATQRKSKAIWDRLFDAIEAEKTGRVG